MNDAERRVAALEVRMLELVVEALEDVRPALVRRLEADAAGVAEADFDHGALCDLAVEAAGKFERVVAERLQGRVATAA
jgi:hypothetical protein